ncbi:MAG: phage tail tape measure protein family, partial [Frankiales bacterium]|nr:phage tail tape measure protein family [Frankiales bacterium]
AQQGKTSAEVGAANDGLRRQFIASARQMGFNQKAAEDLANRYLGIPKNIKTEIKADTSQADAAIASVQRQINGLHDKTITIVSKTITAGGQVSASRNFAALNARGNMIHAFADGGFEPMSSSVAKIVPPNTLRVIGDRVTDDEAFIPINKDLRSQRIWAEAGHRMGLLGSGTASGGSAHVTANVRVYVGSREITDIARVEADAVVGEAFAAATTHGAQHPWG